MANLANKHYHSLIEGAQTNDYFLIPFKEKLRIN